MNTTVPSEMIRFIKAERDSKREHLEAVDPFRADDQWYMNEEPFINELCLMLLVVIRHQVERELVLFAARVTSDGRTLSHREYEQRIRDERENLRKDRWKRIKKKLSLGDIGEWDASMKTLQFLVNSYKHHPLRSPDEDLLKHLGLDLDVKYAPIPESLALVDGLAKSLNLKNGADYCEITEDLLERADAFLAEVQTRARLSSVKRGTSLLLSLDDVLQ